MDTVRKWFMLLHTFKRSVEGSDPNLNYVSPRDY